MSRRQPTAIKNILKALDLLRRPDTKLVRLHTHDGTDGFYIWPSGGRVSPDVAEALLQRNDVQPHDPGLLAGHPQSWVMGNWRRRRKAIERHD